MRIDLEQVLRRAPEFTVRLAVEHVRTLSGAYNLHKAERDGLARPAILRAIERKIAELGGEESPRSKKSILEVHGEARIVEAVGRGKRHPGW